MSRRQLLNTASPRAVPAAPAIKPLRVWLDGRELTKDEYTVDANGVITVKRAQGKVVVEYLM